VSAPRRRRWPFVVALSVLALVGAALAGDWALHTSYFSVRHVRVSGAVHESAAAVLAASGLETHPAMIDVDPGLIARRLEGFPWVRSARVLEHWPSTVTIAITERTAVAVARGYRGQLELVDAAGAILAPAPAGTNLPIVVATGERPGQPWPFTSWARPATAVAATLPLAFSAQVAAIRVDRAGNVTLAMTSPLTFLMGAALDLHNKYVAIAAVIAHGHLNPGDVIDVSVPSSVTVSGP
jgi:cell division protein FtsQ